MVNVKLDLQRTGPTTRGIRLLKEKTEKIIITLMLSVKEFGILSLSWVSA